MSGTLNLHAKTYYNDPHFGGAGDEEYVNVPAFSGEYGSVTGSSTSWTLIDGGVWDQQRPLGGYLHIWAKFGHCLHDHWPSTAELTLTTVLSYWGSKPTGYKSVSWQAELTGTPYHITSVTD